MATIGANARVTVSIAGQPISEAASSALVGVHVEQCLSQPTLCEVTFALPDVYPDDFYRPGQVLRVDVREGVLFSGYIIGMIVEYRPDGAQWLHVRAADALYDLRQQQAVRMHVDITVAEIARNALQRAGHMLAVTLHAERINWGMALQVTEDDLTFLQMLGVRSGIYLAVRGDTLHLLRLGRGISAQPWILRPGDNLHSARIEDNPAHGSGEVIRSGWNLTTMEARRGRVRGKGYREVRLNQALESSAQAEAEAVAQQALRRQVSRTLTATVDGSPALGPGMPVRLVGSVLDGDFILTQVTHTIRSETGYNCEISTLPPVLPSSSQSAVFALGRVTRIRDQRGWGRVRVRLLPFEEDGDVETDWLPVLVPGAGRGKGLLALPDIDDTVLVLLTGMIPAQGVVLGNLYGQLQVPDEGGVGGGVLGEDRSRFSFLTAKGQRIQMDGDRDILRLENGDGSLIELTPQAVRLRAATNLEISAPGRTITLRGRAIDFEQG